MPCNAIFLARIDAAAEREAEAEERMYDLLDLEPPRTRLEVERDYTHAAIARGLPIEKPNYKFNKLLAVRAWENICQRYAGAQPVAAAFRFHLDTRENREERNHRRPEYTTKDEVLAALRGILQRVEKEWDRLIDLDPT